MARQLRAGELIKATTNTIKVAKVAQSGRRDPNQGETRIRIRITKPEPEPKPHQAAKALLTLIIFALQISRTYCDQSLQQL